MLHHMMTANCAKCLVSTANYHDSKRTIIEIRDTFHIISQSFSLKPRFLQLGMNFRERNFHSRELSAIPGKFPGIAKMTKILGISSIRQEKIISFRVYMKNKSINYTFGWVWVQILAFSNFFCSFLEFCHEIQSTQKVK